MSEKDEKCKERGCFGIFKVMEICGQCLHSLFVGFSLFLISEGCGNGTTFFILLHVKNTNYFLSV
jgi:hypothetical protein